MLSKDIRSLQTWFDATRLPGNAMSDEAADAFSLALGTAAEAALVLEGATAAPETPAATIETSTEELIRQARMLARAANIVMVHAAHPLHRVSPDGGVA